MIARLGWAVLAGCAAAVLGLARVLPPAAAGYGTHVALGLPPCGFLSSTGLPCPTCGLTTAFALLSRGEVRAALRVHPLGVPLYAAVVALLLVALVGLVRGRPLLPTLDRMRLDRWALLLAAALMATWLARLLARVSWAGRA